MQAAAAQRYSIQIHNHTVDDSHGAQSAPERKHFRAQNEKCVGQPYQACAMNVTSHRPRHALNIHAWHWSRRSVQTTRRGANREFERSGTAVSSSGKLTNPCSNSPHAPAYPDRKSGYAVPARSEALRLSVQSSFLKHTDFAVIHNPSSCKAAPIHRNIHTSRQSLCKAQSAPQIEQLI